MVNSTALLGIGAIIGAEATGITNFSGSSNDSQTTSNNGNNFPAFAGQIGNQVSELRRSVNRTQNNLQTFQNLAVTGNELTNALSQIDTGPTMSEVESIVNNSTMGPQQMKILFEKYANNQQTIPEESDNSSNPDNGGKSSNGSMSPLELFNLRQQELGLRENEFELSQKEAKNRDLRNSDIGIVADSAEIGVEAGNAVSGFTNWVNNNRITQKSTEGWNDVSQLVGSGKVEKSEGENTSIIGDALSPGPKYHGPDPLNLGGNNEKNTESGNESQNENEERSQGIITDQWKESDAYKYGRL